MWTRETIAIIPVIQMYHEANLMHAMTVIIKPAFTIEQITEKFFSVER